MSAARSLVILALCSAICLASGRELLATSPDLNAVVTAAASSEASVNTLMQKTSPYDVVKQLPAVTVQASATAVANVVIAGSRLDAYATASAFATAIVQSTPKASGVLAATITADASAAAKIYVQAAPRDINVFAFAAADALVSVGAQKAASFVQASAYASSYVSAVTFGNLIKKNPSYAISVLATASASASVNVGSLINLISQAQAFSSVSLSGSQVYAAVSAQANVFIATQLKAFCYA